MRNGDREPWKLKANFWEENTAKTPQEKGFNRYLVETLRMTNRGLLPQVTRGPNSPIVAAFMRAAYGKGYCDALTEDSPCALCSDHGYRVPGRKHQHA